MKGDRSYRKAEDRIELARRIVEEPIRVEPGYQEVGRRWASDQADPDRESFTKGTPENVAFGVERAPSTRDLARRMLSNNSMDRQSMLNQLSSWMRTIANDFSIIEDTKSQTPDIKLAVTFYTHENQYSIHATHHRGGGSHHLGCTATSRRERTGDDQKVTTDLPDGAFSIVTWNAIVAAIVKNESMPIAVRPEGEIREPIKRVTPPFTQDELDEAMALLETIPRHLDPINFNTRDLPPVTPVVHENLDEEDTIR